MTLKGQGLKVVWDSDLLFSLRVQRQLADRFVNEIFQEKDQLWKGQKDQQLVGQLQVEAVSNAL